MITHDFSLQILREGRVPVGKAVDLSLPAVLQLGVEALHWRSFLAGKCGVEDPVRVSPRWSADLGAPVVTDILLEAGEFSVALPVKRLFKASARRASTQLVAEGGLLGEGDAYGFLVTARPADDPAPLPVFHLNEYPLEDEGLESGGETIDHPFGVPDDFVVSISGGVVEEAVRLANAAGEAETGGVLFGRLVREARHGGVMLAVTHLCPAAGGHGDGTSFTFTPETWTLAQAVLTERPAGEMMVGSYHSHPDFCVKCPPERQAECAMRKPFFSEDDVRLHETVFPAAYSVGLLASHDGTRFIPSLWGWRDGFIARRSYLIHH